MAGERGTRALEDEEKREGRTQRAGGGERRRAISLYLSLTHSLTHSLGYGLAANIFRWEG